jgi:uracil-DNA glycosylase
LGIDKPAFYSGNLFALMPMGFCYPGKEKRRFAATTKICTLWHSRLLAEMKKASLILLIGQYAQKYYLGIRAKETLTETGAHFRNYLPDYFSLPHPSPRNNNWQAKNKWFGLEVLPTLKTKIKQIISS